jgi:hypothetical protein
LATYLELFVVDGLEMSFLGALEVADRAGGIPPQVDYQGASTVNVSVQVNRRSVKGRQRSKAVHELRSLKTTLNMLDSRRA